MSNNRGSAKHYFVLPHVLFLISLFAVSVSAAAIATNMLYPSNQDHVDVENAQAACAPGFLLPENIESSRYAVANTEVIHSAPSPDGNCLQCHGNAGYLIKHVTPPEAPPEDGCATATTRPAFLDAFVKSEFIDTVHGQIGCTGCHGGDSEATTVEAAHVGITSAEKICADCHSDIVKRHETSLHSTLNGMKQALLRRSGEDNFHALQPMWESDCGTCHAGCSDCHITQPEAVGGGLLQGHTFFKQPPMEDTCAVCHGSRAGGEYLGKFDGVEADVHFQANMHCTDCHTNDLHGDGNQYEHRWDVEGRPSCTNCHDAVPNDLAQAHGDSHEELSCQSCHAQAYQNCFGCHASVEDGEYVRRADKKTLEFKIGKNTVPGYPHSIVPLRHNPVAHDSFDYFGSGLLPNFDNFPNWKTAAPHNIVKTPVHGATCAACHSNSEIFLKSGDLDPHEPSANRGSVLDKYKGQR